VILVRGDQKEKACHSLRSFTGYVFPFAYESKLSTQRKNKARHFRARLFLLSGWQDSNLRPSGPKPDALTGLRYTPNIEAQKYHKFSDFIIYQQQFENFLRVSSFSGIIREKLLSKNQ
jgi:hypothetical protein